MKEHHGDLVVVGGGLAGMTCAVRAAQAGRRVLVLEQGADERYLCNSRVAGGVFHVCARDIFSDEAALEQSILQVTGGLADPGLAKAMARDAKRAGRWLQTQGIRFMRGSPEPFHNFVLAPPALIRAGLEYRGRAGDVALRTLETVLQRAGGAVLRGHRATVLLGGDGRCTGVEGDAAQQPFRVVATNTVLADGGFQADPELVARHLSPAPARLLQRNARSGRGDGLRMAVAFGAQCTRMDGFYGHLLARAAMTNDKLWPMPWMDDIATAAILVDARGQRFTDEGLGGVVLANRVAALDDPLSTAIVFDDAIWQVAGGARFFPARPYVEQHGAELLRAGTLAELAQHLAVPAEALVRSVSAYNRALETGALSSLAPPRSEVKARAMPIRGGPFMAARVCVGITYTMGGIAIDASSRVLGGAGRPIDGLYAAGATTGGLEGGDKVGYVGGLTKASVTGLRAAEHMLGVLH